MSLDLVRKTFTKWAPIYNATHAWILPGRRTARPWYLRAGLFLMDASFMVYCAGST